MVAIYLKLALQELVVEVFLADKVVVFICFERHIFIFYYLTLGRN